MSEQPPVKPPDTEESPIEEYAMVDLELILESAKEPYYLVDAIKDPHTKRKLIDPRAVLTPNFIRIAYENWGVSRDKVIRVTRDLDAIDQFYDVGSKTVAHYAAQIHRYLVNIFTVKKPSHKAEVQGLAASAAEMLNGIFGWDKIETMNIGPADLRPVTSYYDHLTNTAIYWLAAFSRLNRRRASETGAIESWRSKSKDEMRKISDPLSRKTNLIVYYDYYGFDRAPSDLEQYKKGDLGLVLSGFFGALFHDLAFLNEQRVLISIKGKIDEKLKQHPDESNRILKDRLLILSDERPLTRNIIKHHHEYVDGSGYPLGKKEKDLHLFTQILSIVDMYDEYATRYVRGKIIRLMSRCAGREFEGDALRAFLGILRPYETGENLDVYEGNIKEPIMRAEVLDSQNFFHPKIQVIEKLATHIEIKAGDIIDLSADENVIYYI
jgi:hypothetical protein